MMAGARCQLAVAHRTKFASQRVTRHRQFELVVDPLRQIGETPAHDIMGGRDRPPFDRCSKPGTLSVVEDRGATRRLARYQTIRPTLTES